MNIGIVVWTVAALGLIIGLCIGILVSPHTTIGLETFNSGVELGRKQQQCKDFDPNSTLDANGNCVVSVIVKPGK